VQRGEVVSSPGALRPSYMLDVSIHFLESNKKPIKNRTLIRFHTGTSEILGHVVLLDKDEIIPGETTVAQIRLDSPVVVVSDDKFVIRSYSPVRTIGGGQILNPLPQKHKRFKKSISEGLKTLITQPPEEIIAYHVDNSGYRGVSFSDLKIMTNMSEKQLDNALQKLMSIKTVLCADRENRIYIHKNCFENLNKKILFFLENYHRTNPLKAGMPKEELKSKLPSAGLKLFNLILDMMIKNKEVISEEETVRLSSHTVSLGGDQAEVKEKILTTYLKSGLCPPYFKDLSKTLDIDAKRAKAVLMLLVEQGIIIKTKEDLYFHAEAVNNLKKRLVDFLLTHGEITTPQFKEMTGTTRKYLIPLIEYFDSKNVTIRIGDIRRLRST
jgi:selenocysteine-specific elongation factor